MTLLAALALGVFCLLATGQLVGQPGRVRPLGAGRGARACAAAVA